MKVRQWLVLIGLTALSLAHAQGNTGNRLSDDGSNRDQIAIANVLKYTEVSKFSAPLPNQGTTSCRIWIRGVSEGDEYTLFSSEINDVLLRKGYFPLQRGGHHIRYEFGPATVTLGIGMASIKASIEKTHRFDYNYDRPVQGDFLLKVDYSFKGKFEQLNGAFARFGKKIFLAGDPIPNWDGTLAASNGTFIEDLSSPVTDLKENWLGGSFHIKVSSLGQVDPRTTDGHSRGFRKAFKELIENMPYCDSLDSSSESAK